MLSALLRTVSCTRAILLHRSEIVFRTRKVLKTQQPATWLTWSLGLIHLQTPMGTFLYTRRAATCLETVAASKPWHPASCYDTIIICTKIKFAKIHFESFLNRISLICLEPFFSFNISTLCAALELDQGFLEIECN